MSTARTAPFNADEIVSWRETAPIRGARALDRYFCTPVVGDSLTHDGIEPGDYLIIKAARSAEYGDLIVTNTPKGRIIKYLTQHPEEMNRVILRCANSKYRDVDTPRKDVEVIGIVRRAERDLLVDGREVIETVKEFDEHEPSDFVFRAHISQYMLN